jgi:hypothetical protein
LVPQCEVLEHEGALGPEHAEEAGEDEGNHAGHHRSDRPKVNADKADGVNRRHSGPVQKLAARGGSDPVRHLSPLLLR